MHGDVLIVDADPDRLERMERLETGRIVQRTSSIEAAVRFAESVDFALILVMLDALSMRAMALLPDLGQSAPVYTFGRSPTNWPFGWSPKQHYPRMFDLDALEAWIDASIARLQAERRAKTFERQLLHAERLVAVGQLAAGVAHEINNPAAFVTTNLCLLDEHRVAIERAQAALQGVLSEDAGRTWQDDYGRDLQTRLDDVRDIVRENLEGMGRISSIVRDLKNFSRIERSSIEVVHPNEVVNAACNLVQNQIRHRAQLVREAGEVRALNADRNKLTQVLTNLLINAVHALPDDDADQHLVRVRTSSNPEHVVIEVSDTGRGIPPALQEKIFEPFFTTKKRDKGTGLGLALCADIVRQHGGAIEVHSRPGLGSTFTITLPIDNGLQPSRVELSPTLRTPSAAEPRSGRLLIVDDELMLLKAYRRTLSKRYEVVFAEGGQQALDILGEDAAFDLVVCDLMMPQVDGIRVYEETHARHPHLRHRFLFCSGGAFTPRARQFCADTPNQLLEKPLAPKALEEAIQEALAQVEKTGDFDTRSVSSDDFPPFDEDTDSTRSLT